MKCAICKKKEASIALRVCADCIKKRWKKAKPLAEEAHKKSIERFGLPSRIPKKGILCGLCANNCKIPEGEKGYCGLRMNKGGKIIHLAGTPKKGLLNYYYDDLPTTSWEHAHRCAEAARRAGLRRVRIGNIHLLR